MRHCARNLEFTIFGSVLLAVAAFPLWLALWLLTTNLIRKRKGALDAD
jgi:hypothetical protein